MHIIIDADPIVYRAGFAAETHNYQVIAEHENGTMQEIFFVRTKEETAGDQMKAWLKETKAKVLSKECIVEAEPLEFALRGVKLTIQACINDVQKQHGEAEQITVLLSGPNNFRNTLATIKKYKGNRDSAYKPVHYQAIRDYLCDYWNADVVEGHEADDECSILAHMDLQKSVVCTIDKDLDQIPCLHYDYSKKVFYEPDEEEARSVFWTQLLCGDSTDNIQGLYKVGEKKAQKLLQEWTDHDDFQQGRDTEDYLWCNVVEAYADNIEEYSDKYPEGMTAYQAALENARLVFIQTYRGQLWSPPGRPEEVTT
jgi:5'-3' exonuclease